MAYIPSECTIEQYNNAVYSQDARHKLYLKIGETVVEEPDNFCESMTLKNLLLDDGSKNFHLDNFVSKSIELILHDYLLEDLTKEIDIRLGTYINPTIGYVYVPIGLYKIQDSPTTNKNKTTYKLRDRSINFDFGYNAKELIDNSSKTDENGNKYVTKLEIVDDICSKAGVEYVGDREFIGYDDKIGIYDNSISGRMYIAYIFEQAGRIATINREGNLTSILINNNLSVQTLPFDLIESYTIGESYKVSKVIYESGSIYFENGTADNDMLFINGTNPYIAKQEELDRIANSINGFELDSYSISKIIGNPAIDSYDLISLELSDKTYKTLGQYNLKYNGKLIQKFETLIEYEARKTNTTKNGENAFKKFVRSEIDNINATLTTTIQETETIKNQTDNNLDEIRTLQSKVTQDKAELEISISQINQTVQENQAEIQENIDNINSSLADGVETLKNTLVTIDINGISVSANLSAISTLMSNDRFSINSKSGELFFVGYDYDLQKTVSRIDNLTVTNYFTAGYHRTEKFEIDGEKRTGDFYVGGEY